MKTEPARGGADGTGDRIRDRIAGPEIPTRLSQAVLLWERLEVALWKPVALVVAFLALALTGLLPMAGPWAQSALLTGFGAAFFYLIHQGIRAFRAPGAEAARRRLETDNALANRPLEALEDRPSTDDPVQLALWREHRRRVLASLGRLKVGGPRPQLAKRDPLALRLAAGFFLVLGLGAAGAQGPDRLQSALLPDFTDREALARITLDAWLTPPDYTGLAPMFIAHAGEGAEDGRILGADHAAPVGSRLVIQVSGAREGATLITPTATVPLESFAANGLATELELTETATYRVEADEILLAEWTLRAVPDEAPIVLIPEEPGPTARFALTIPFDVSDDHGIETLNAVIERADRPLGSAQANAGGDEEMAIVTPLPIPDRAGYGETRRGFRDFTAHPWAGGEVRLTLVATDALGQEGRSETVTTILPARPFQHPVAQAIADLRRELAWDPARNHRPVADALTELAWDHEAYGDAVTVFLALRESSRRLAPTAHAGTPSTETVAEVVDLLWKTALYLEDGGISLALARLRAAEQALMEALAEGAEPAELERLMDELQSAMDEYMRAMTEQLQQRMAEGEEVPQLGPDANMVSPDDLDQMLDEMREMMRNGMTETAQQMLEQLRRMMENMQAGAQMQMSPEGQQAMDMLESMQDIMEGQRELMDRTHQNSQNQQGQGGEGQQQRSQNGQNGGEGNSQSQGNDGQRADGGPNSADAVLQDALRRQLGEIMRQFGEMMGEIPEPFGRADQGMAESAERLSDGDPRNALESQGDAMDALQDAANAARNAFMERFQNPLGALGQQMPGQNGQRDADPFGREPSDAFRGPMQGEVEVPDEGSIERAREIRDELRRRAGQRDRPPAELDYIDRLLDQFR
jgi:uncharacterized protein (TIGR02302 family)